MELVEAALGDTRVVIVNGARQAGKSTLVHAAIQGRHDVVERRLDRPSDLAGARHDPETFVRHGGLLVIDEIQRAPEIVLPIKAQVDLDNRPGQYLITGSARLLGMRALPDSLIGRSETIELWPFSQGEIDGTPDDFVRQVFAEQPASWPRSETGREEYLERAVRGGYPEAVRRAPERRNRWFGAYINALIDRDVMQLSEIQRRDDLHRLLRLLASRPASPLAVANIASDLGVPKTTVERYLVLFEEVFLVKRIPPWSTSATARATHQRKLVFVDSGLAAHLSARGLARLQRDASLAGALLENFVLSELGRQLSWNDEQATLHHYRDRDGREIDAILEHGDGRVVAIEVKASSTVDGNDFRHIRHLRRLIGDRLVGGYVLYTGAESVPFGDNLYALSIDHLWR